MRTIKIVGRNRIFSPLYLIKAVRNKRKIQLITKLMCQGDKELTAGFTRFYQVINNYAYSGRLLK